MLGGVGVEELITAVDRRRVILGLDGLLNAAQGLFLDDQALQPAFQDALVDGLEQVFVGFDLGRTHHHFGGLFGRDHDPDGGDADVVVQPCLVQHLLAIEAGTEVEVADHHVVAAASQQVQCFPAIGCGVHVRDPHGPDNVAQDGAHALEVIDDEGACFGKRYGHVQNTSRYQGSRTTKQPPP